jgi:hypothetical protein
LTLIAIVTPAYAAEREIQSFFEEVLEQPFNKQIEDNNFKASHGRAERQGAELILWSGAAAGAGMRLVFRDGPQPQYGPGIVHYSYYGGTEFYDLIVEELPRQPLAIHLVERNGVAHRFSVDDLSPYLTASGHHLLSIGKYGDLHILGVRATDGYQEEFTCLAKPPMVPQNPEIHAFNDDIMEIELVGPLGAPRVLTLHRDGRHWKIIEPAQMWRGYSCN